MDVSGLKAVYVVLHVVQAPGAYLYAAKGDGVGSRERISPCLGMAGPK